MIGATFVARSYAESDELLYSFRPGRQARIASRGLLGCGDRRPRTRPLVAPHTPSRDRVLLCTPHSGSSDAVVSWHARHERIFAALARRAYRRPVTDADLQKPLYCSLRTGRKGGDFISGIQNGMMPILASPKFLFRAENVPVGVTAGTNYRISDLDLCQPVIVLSCGRARRMIEVC